MWRSSNPIFCARERGERERERERERMRGALLCLLKPFHALPDSLVASTERGREKGDGRKNRAATGAPRDGQRRERIEDRRATTAAGKAHVVVQASEVAAGHLGGSRAETRQARTEAHRGREKGEREGEREGKDERGKKRKQRLATRSPTASERSLDSVARVFCFFEDLRHCDAAGGTAWMVASAWKGNLTLDPWTVTASGSSFFSLKQHQTHT